MMTSPATTHLKERFLALPPSDRRAFALWACKEAIQTSLEPVDEWHDAIASWAAGRSRVTVSEVAQALGLDMESGSMSDLTRITSVLTRLGYVNERVMIDGVHRSVWVR